MKYRIYMWNTGYIYGIQDLYIYRIQDIYGIQDRDGIQDIYRIQDRDGIQVEINAVLKIKLKI